MVEQAWLNAAYGGLVIGFSAALFLLLEGRVLGVSGITGRVGYLKKGDTSWRVLFVLGLVSGGYLGSRLWPDSFVNIQNESNYVRLALAGLLVGFGTKLSGGCTSGHGVCGIGRLSVRGIVATVTFMAFGVLTVLLVGR